MAGHNKWSKIRHRKAAVEKRRGKVWTKVAKAIIVAARHGGGDPDTNLPLRYAIDEGRYANMPRDTIERAIKKGAGGEDTSHYETVRYEGYGPHGVAVIVDALTDNRTRTAGDLRLAFSKYAGNLGTTGCVGFLFEAKGRILIGRTPVEEERASRRQVPFVLSDDAVMEIAAGAGAEDVEPIEGEEEEGVGGRSWAVLTAPTEYLGVKAAIEAALAKAAPNYAVIDAMLDMVPSTEVPLGGEPAETMHALIEMLEDNDDVQKVYTNFVPAE